MFVCVKPQFWKGLFKCYFHFFKLLYTLTKCALKKCKCTRERCEVTCEIELMFFVVKITSGCEVRGFFISLKLNILNLILCG